MYEGRRRARPRPRLRVIGLGLSKGQISLFLRILLLLIILGLVLPRLIESAAAVLIPKPVPGPRIPMGHNQLEDSLSACRNPHLTITAHLKEKSPVRPQFA